MTDAELASIRTKAIEIAERLMGKLPGSINRRIIGDAETLAHELALVADRVETYLARGLRALEVRMQDAEKK